MSASPPTVLVVDDDPRALEGLRCALAGSFRVLTASSTPDAMERMTSDLVHIILSAQRLSCMSGVEFLRHVRARWPDTVRIALCHPVDLEDVIEGIHEAGIWQYLVKPWHPEQLVLTLTGAARLWSLQKENQQLALGFPQAPPLALSQAPARRTAAKGAAGFGRIIRAPDSPANEVCRLAMKVAPHELAILLTGESGTGKELLARAIHQASSRAGNTFVVENCGALPDQLLEAELFGHKRGAFTGAYEDRIGLFQLANGGTLFLDEVGETSPAFQVKLLRALQEGEIRPLGSPRSVSVDVRVIAATNHDLEEDMRAGRFREDLYYRLAGMTLTMPPLRERPMDIAPIAQGLLERFRNGRKASGFSSEALHRMAAYRWPGNVREMQNEIQRMLALAEGEWLGAELLSARVLRGADGDTQERDLALLAGLDGSLKERIEQLEARLIREVLVRRRWNKTRAAQELGLSRVGLRQKLARYGLEKIE